MTFRDIPLSTRQMADWMGVSQDYVYGELTDGLMPFENIARTPGRTEYRVRLSDFIRYLQKRGYRRLPRVEEFN